MAQRYGKLPHEILALDTYELSVAMRCMLHGDAHAGHMIDRITSRDGGMVFPVVVVAR